MPWIKSASAGFVGSLIMFILMKFAILQGIAPFSVPPSAAFLEILGLPMTWLAPIAHFSYGIFWSMVLLALFWDQTSIKSGIGLSIGLWIFMMLVYSPIIGWGFFGMNSAADLPEKLQLASTLRFLISTFILHLIYGFTIGLVNSTWISFGHDVAQEIRQEASKDQISDLT